MSLIAQVIRRFKNGTPPDRWLSADEYRPLAREVIALRKEMDQTDAERNALIDLVKSQRAEIAAFKAAGAASMETHNTEET